MQQTPNVRSYIRLYAHINTQQIECLFLHFAMNAKFESTRPVKRDKEEVSSVWHVNRKCNNICSSRFSQPYVLCSELARRKNNNFLIHHKYST